MATPPLAMSALDTALRDLGRTNRLVGEIGVGHAWLAILFELTAPLAMSAVATAPSEIFAEPTALLARSAFATAWLAILFELTAPLARSAALIVPSLMSALVIRFWAVVTAPPPARNASVTAIVVGPRRRRKSFMTVSPDWLGVTDGSGSALRLSDKATRDHSAIAQAHKGTEVPRDPPSHAAGMRPSTAVPDPTANSDLCGGISALQEDRGHIAASGHSSQVRRPADPQLLNETLTGAEPASS